MAFQGDAFQADTFESESAFVDGALAVTGTGTFVAAGSRAIPGALASSGVGTIVLGGELGIVYHDGALAVTGTGSVALTASVLLSGALAPTGTGAVTFAASVSRDGALAVSGVGTIGLDGSLGELAPAAISLTGTGAFVASPSALEWAAALDLTGEGFLTALGERVLPTGTGPSGEDVSFATTAMHEPRVISITIGGVDVTDVVRYRDASFQSQVNGSAAPCSFAVRDTGHTWGFTTGHEIVLTIDGDVRWRGYVAKIHRQYSAAVVDTTDPDVTARWFLIEGVDINILFQKRIVYHKLTPERGVLPPPPAYRDAKHPDQWRAGSPANVIVKHVISTRTDLLADGIDISGVIMLDSPNPDFAGAFTGAMTVGDFMRSVNKLLGGVFYITPDKRLMYHPVETATTNFYLTDAVGGGGVTDWAKPQDYSLLSDAAAMVNDAMVWGTAPGVSTVAFRRERDLVSRDDHGLWQYGEFNETMYKQSSVNKRANAIVYGNVASRLGAHWDRISAEATVFAPVFWLGDVVRCENYTFTENHVPPFGDVGDLVPIIINLPVRRMIITFPTPTSTRWQLLITQELDDPWNIYEFVFPRFNFNFPQFDIPPFPGPVLPGAFPCATGAYLSGPLVEQSDLTGPFDGDDPIWSPPWVNWYEPPDDEFFGTSSDLAGVGLEGGDPDKPFGKIGILSGGFGVQRLYAATAPWNRNAFVSDFRFQVSDVTTSSTVRFVLGAATVEIDPDTTTGEVRLISPSGTSFVAYTSWVANTWYVARVRLDLLNDRIAVDVFPEGSSGVNLERESNGERVGDGFYRPFIGVWLETTTGNTLRVSQVTSESYTDGVGQATNLFGGEAGPDGWGPPWVTYSSTTVEGTPTQLTFGADGTIERLVAGGTAHIDRLLDPGIGSIDVAFSLSDYDFPAEGVISTHFQLEGNLRQRAFIGNVIQLSSQENASVVFSDNVESTLFDAGDPVNVRIQFNDGAFRIKLWAGGTAEPDAWTATIYRDFSTWPPAPYESDERLRFGISADMLVGESVKLGNVVTDTTETPSWLITGGAILSTTGVSANVFSTPGDLSRGRTKSWPFDHPGDGRDYAVSWGTDVYVAAGVSEPSYDASLVWAQFDLGPGVPRDAHQNVVAGKLARPQIAGIDVPFEVIIRGELGVALNGFSSGSGVAEVTAALRTFNWDITQEDPPPPAVSDYFINGRDEQLVTNELTEGGEPVWTPFVLRLDSRQIDNYGISNEDENGRRWALWGVDVKDAFDKIRDAGPFDQNGVLTAHVGQITTDFRDLDYEMVLHPTPVFGIPRADPCDPVPTDESAPPGDSGTHHEDDFEPGSTVYNLGSSYVPGSVMIWVGGALLIPVLDFTETDYVAGIVTLNDVPTQTVHIDWTILGGPI